MMNQKHLMLDIETMDSSPTSAVIAIGARIFTLEGPGKGFEVFIDPGVAIHFGTVSPDTMDWWSKQPARELVFGGRTDPAAAVHKFIQFVQEHNPDTVWANSPSFDCIIMRHLCKQVQMKFPLHYRDERDVRTFLSLGRDLGVDFEGCWEGLTAHSPLDDSTAQAQAMVRVLRHLVSMQAGGSGQGSVPHPAASAQLAGAAALTASATGL
jgi:3' exoribonuclease, RNase T-like